MSQLRSTLHHDKKDQILVQGPEYDEYDMIVVSRNRIDSGLNERLVNLKTVVHKTLMIKELYLEWARELVGDKLKRKNAGLGSIFSALVKELSKEKQRKKRLLQKLRDCFDLVIEDTELMISNRKHGRISQYEYYQKRANKGRLIFKRLYYEYAFDDEDLREEFSKDEIKQVKTWITSSQDNFSQALESWVNNYKSTKKQKIWEQ